MYGKQENSQKEKKKHREKIICASQSTNHRLPLLFLSKTDPIFNQPEF